MTAITFMAGVALHAMPVIDSSSSCTFGTTYTATANSSFGPLEWALGTGSTAVGAAIDPTSGRIAYSSVGTVVVRVRDTGDAGHAPTAFTSDFTITVTKATIGLSLSNLAVAYDGNAHAVLVTPAAIVSTIAGAFSATPSSSDGVGTAARFASPVGIAVAADGTLYVTDNFAIRKISTLAQVTTLAGTPGIAGAVDATGASARFSSLAGLVVDGDGNLLVADASNNVIRKVAVPGAVVTTVAGALGAGSGSTNGAAANARFNIPTSLALSGTGDVYVAEFNGPTIRKISGGVVSTIAGLAATKGGADGPGLTARFEFPTSVARASMNRYYVTDQTGTVRRIEADGSVVTVAGAFRQTGSIDGPGATARFSQPWGIAVDAQDNVYVSDYWTSVVRKISPEGLVTTIAGSPNQKGTADGAGSTGRFANPMGVAIDTQGVLYVADLSNGMIRRVVGAGGVLTVTYDGSTTVPSAPGTYNVVATLNHANWEGTTSGTLTITAVSLVAPVISSSNAMTFGQSYTATVNNSDAGYGPVQWALGTGSTAAGAAINASTGAVTTTGVGKVVIRARFAGDSGHTASPYSADFTITVGQVGQSAPVISSAHSFLLGSTYTATANTGVGALNWTLGAGSTAAGAAINATTGAVTATSAGTVVIQARFEGDTTTSPSPYTADFVILVISESAKSDFNGDGNPDLVLQNQATGARTLRLMNGTTLVSETALSGIVTPWSIAATADFNADAKPDLLLQNLATGARKIRLMNGSVAGAEISLGVIPAAWSMAAVADFNGDRKADIVWQNTTTGERSIWLMNGTTLAGDVSLGVVAVEWSIAAAADFNSDGKADLVWQNTTTGERSVWLMNGTTFLSAVSLGIVPVEWSIAVAADFNRDGKPDLLWQNTATGQCNLWFMNGTTFISDADLGSLPAGWSLAGVQGQQSLASTHDFNGDDKADILWQNTTTGERYLWFMNGTSFLGAANLGTVALDWSIAATADFNADGKPDLLWQNTTTGERYVWFMNGTSFLSAVSLGVVPVQWSIAAAADFNSDGKPDILWQNTATGERYLWFMSGATYVGAANLNTIAVAWSIAAAADFNGDGKTDILWQNTATGERYVWFMDGTTFIGASSLGAVALDWRIVSALDLNGDGKADVLWENTTTGERYVWFMDSTAIVGHTSLGTVQVEWSIAD